MKLIVQKYGGTSVATPEKIKNVARRIAKAHSEGNGLVIVLSAMAKETDRLINLSKETSAEPHPKYVDLLISTGEQVTVSLMAMALEELGVPTETFFGHNISILTDENFGSARIKDVNITPIKNAVDTGKIAVVAGFQGLTKDGVVTTIGRGGSDLSAVALAAAIKAEYCEIFTDVDGVFTTDPKLCKGTNKLEKISYEEMLELADTGAKVLHTRAVEVAAKYSVPIHVRSSFNNEEGTWVVPENKEMEDTLVSGISLNIDEAKVAIRRVPDKVGVTAKIFEPIAKARINVDMIIQNVSEDGYTDLTFTVPKADLKKAMILTEGAAKKVEAGKVEAAGNIAKVSVVGVGMRSHAGVAHKIFETLAKEGIAIQMIGTSEIKVSIIVDMKHAQRAVQILHAAFNL